jgi:DNA mismatch repair ATPase MutS
VCLHQLEEVPHGAHSSVEGSYALHCAAAVGLPKLILDRASALLRQEN